MVPARRQHLIQANRINNSDNEGRLFRPVHGLSICNTKEWERNEGVGVGRGGGASEEREKKIQMLSTSWVKSGRITLLPSLSPS